MQIVAKVGRLYGSKGELSLNLNSNFPREFSLATPLFVVLDGLTVPLYCEEFVRRGVNGANVQFADIDSERRAIELVGSDLYMQQGEQDFAEQSQIVDMDSLIGFTVRVESMEGELTAYYPSEMNPLFEVLIDGREVLIPAQEEFIESVDIEGREISFNLPEGLMEL
ncbi:MAG: 16S rRNA processing protein RimM [Rikenellaceae bacterium]